MKITCQACGAKYTIADDKVRGRKVKIRCKGCSAPIVVDAQQEGSAEPAADATAPDVGAAMEAAGPSAPPPAEAWSVNLSDTDQRTMSSDEIVAGYKSGLVTSDAFVWKEGMADWVALFDCAELAPLLGAAPAAAAPAPAPAPASLAAESPFVPPAAAAAASPKPAAVGAKLSGSRAGAVDLFGGVQNAGSEEEEIATGAPNVHQAALPTAGSTAYGDDKMTGQRNENSVLFSLDSLKAGLNEAPKPATTSSPKKGVAPPRKGAASAPQQQSDPFGMGGANDLMNIGGGGNALFSMNANQALLTAPAPPEPPPPRSTDVGLAGPLSVSSVAPKKGKGLIIGAAIAVVGLIVIGAVAMSGGDGDKDKAEGTTPSATAEMAAAATAETPKPEEKKEEPKAEEKKEEPAPAPSAAPAASAAATTEAPKSTTPTSGGPGPKTTPKEKEEPAPAAAAAPFSISAAQAALGSAAGGAGSCKKPGGPTGSGKVQVTFAPSGRVTSANVAGPPFAGTAVGGCVAGVFRRAKVPPFSGNPVTVSKSFSVN
ncbi:MAG TPA: zinc-ribbon domain-containing protein [Polyangiaceae bacterium]|nr:zinc-ribbon domain-containing protein [Polyangiaceae bacterium]